MRGRVRNGREHERTRAAQAQAQGDVRYAAVAEIAMDRGAELGRQVVRDTPAPMSHNWRLIPCIHYSGIPLNEITGAV